MSGGSHAHAQAVSDPTCKALCCVALDWLQGL